MAEAFPRPVCRPRPTLRQLHSGAHRRERLPGFLQRVLCFAKRDAAGGGERGGSLVVPRYAAQPREIVSRLDVETL